MARRRARKAKNHRRARKSRGRARWKQNRLGARASSKGHRRMSRKGRGRVKKGTFFKLRRKAHNPHGYAIVPASWGNKRGFATDAAPDKYFPSYKAASQWVKKHATTERLAGAKKMFGISYKREGDKIAVMSAGKYYRVPLRGRSVRKAMSDLLGS